MIHTYVQIFKPRYKYLYLYSNHLYLGTNDLKIGTNHLKIGTNHLKIVKNHFLGTTYLDLPINHLNLGTTHLDLPINHLNLYIRYKYNISTNDLKIRINHLHLGLIRLRSKQIVIAAMPTVFEDRFKLFEDKID